MKFVKNILGRIFACWTLMTFVVTFFIIFIPSLFCWLIPDPKGLRLFVLIARVWMNVWLRITGCSFSVHGKNNFEPGKTYIVTCNHNSLLDIPLSFPFIPGANKTIAKASFAKIPFFGLFYMRGSILVNRKSEISRRQSFDKMKTTLRKGIHVCLYPEGSRNRTTEPLKKFYSGAFKLAVDAGHDIIPAVLFNTKNVLPLNKPFYFWPGKIEIHFLQPVPSATQSAEELKNRVFSIMKDYYTAHQY